MKYANNIHNFLAYFLIFEDVWKLGNKNAKKTILPKTVKNLDWRRFGEVERNCGSQSKKQISMTASQEKDCE